MIRFLEKLNTPWVVAAVMAFFLVVDGCLFYRYQQRFELDNAIMASVDAETIAAEETTMLLEQGPSTSEEPADPVEGQEPAIEEEIVVPEETADSPTEEEETVAAGAVRVVVGVTGAPSWLRVQEDRQIVLDQLSQPSFSREFVADRAISIQAGNAGAVRVEVDGRDLGPLGADGEVATRTYTTQKGTEASK